MKTMVQKYSAYHTLMVIILGVVLIISGNSIQLTLDDFETFYGKAIFTIVLLYIMVPILVNTFSMLWNMLKNGKWLYFFSTFFLAYLVTVIYYFKVYRKK